MPQRCVAFGERTFGRSGIWPNDKVGFGTLDGSDLAVQRIQLVRHHMQAWLSRRVTSRPVTLLWFARGWNQRRFDVGGTTAGHLDRQCDLIERDQAVHFEVAMIISMITELQVDMHQIPLADFRRIDLNPRIMGTCNTRYGDKSGEDNGWFQKTHGESTPEKGDECN